MTDQDINKNEDIQQHNADDDYELPPGIILPQDDSADYPDWKKGFLTGIMGGMFGAFAVWLLWLAKIIKAENGILVMICGFVFFFLVAGSIAAFRPPKK